MSVNRTVSHLDSNSTGKDLTYNKKDQFIYNLAEESVIYCGNLAFSDWSTSNVSLDEKEKYDNCMNNMEKISMVLSSINN